MHTLPAPPSKLGRRRNAPRLSFSAAAVITAAMVSAAFLSGSASASSKVPLPHTSIGQQLGWVISQVNQGASSLGEPEAKRHLSPRFLATIPAMQIGEVVSHASAAYAPIRFLRFASRPSATRAIALIKTRTHDKLAIYVSLDRRAPHLINALDFTPRPLSGRSTMAVANRYTGRFAISGGRKIFLRCSGSGTPTVILEAGANGGADAWFAVQPWLATTTRVCSYDRANLPGGRSDPAPKPQSAANIVGDLHDLLAVAHVPGPYVFAGHSNGGLFARLYATTYPQQVKGLVLIDTGNYPAMINGLYKKMMSKGQWRAYQATLRHQPAFIENPLDEQVDLATSYRQLRFAQHRHPLPTMPLIVISRGLPEPAMGREVIPGITKAIEKAWRAMQIKLTTVVPGGQRLVATRSDHMIPTGQPALVVSSIREVLARIKAPTH